MNKQYILYSVLLLGSLGLSSCKKWLAEDPESSIVSNQYYKTADDAQSAVLGIYDFVHPPFDKQGYDDMPYSMLELVTGVYVNEAQSTFANEFYNLRYDPTCTDVAIWWDNCYEGIEAANLAIANITAIQMDTSSRNALVGEARFLRAWFYYNLVNIFGPVPLKTTPTEDAGAGNLPRSSVADIYNKVIVPDLLYAEQQPLNETTNGNGRASIGAAQSLLAKVYLSMAGALGQSSDYALAAAAANQVIQSGNYTLFQSDGTTTWFNKLNNPAYDNTQEHIWMVNYLINKSNSSVTVYFLPKQAIFTPFLQFGGFYPTVDFLDAYPAGDLRGLNNQGFYYDSITVSGTTYHFPWAIYKFFDPGIIQNSPNSSKNFPLIRYADILLTYAEAENEADGSPNTQSYTALNSIRARAGLAALGGLSQADFRTEVWKERYYELSAECKIWFDIVRTGKVFDPATGAFVPVVGHMMPSGATFSQANMQFPIPASEVQINPLLGN